MLRKMAVAAAMGCACGAMAGDPPPFVQGDIYLASQDVPGGLGPGWVGLIKIEPDTWTVTDFLIEPPLRSTTVAYDPARDALIGWFGGGPTDPRFIYADATTEPFTVNWPGATTGATLFAPAGDGRIFVYRPWLASPLGLMDDNGNVTTILNEAGDAPLTLPGFSALTHLVYDPGERSLIGVAIDLMRIPLNEAGTHAAGAITEQSFSHLSSSGESSRGIGRGPNGKLFMKIDDNTSGLVGRMQLIDPADLSLQTYASSEYFGVGGEMAGAWSSTINAAVVLDTFNHSLRRFNHGQAGEGTVVVGECCTNGGAGEMVSIEPFGAACPGDATGDGTVGFGDLNAVLAQFGQTGQGLQGDLNGDGVVDFSDLNEVLVSFGTTC